MRFSTGCPFVLSPSHSTLRKHDIGSISSENGSLHPPLSELLIQPELQPHFQPCFASHKLQKKGYMEMAEVGRSHEPALTSAK